jgi:DNA-3-methyladenine glycosylase II
MSTRVAVRRLVAADPVLGQVIAQVGACGLRPRAEGSHFNAIARAIVYQQLSGKAAATIYGRFAALFPRRAPTPPALLALSDEALRAAGLSRQKLAYLRDLAAHASDGRLPLRRIDRLADEEVLEALTAVKGVGVWTAQMFLLFRLGRPNVLPDTDLGIQKAVQRAYALRSLPSPAKVRQIGEPWQPYCSVASWYLWRSLDALP